MGGNVGEQAISDPNAGALYTSTGTALLSYSDRHIKYGILQNGYWQKNVHHRWWLHCVHQTSGDEDN